MKQLRKTELKKFKKNEEKHNKKIVLILENIQYAQNVANIFRTADAVKVEKIILTGISQKPPFGKTLQKVSRSKEKSVQWQYEETSGKAINLLKKKGYQIIGLEITDNAQNFTQFKFLNKVCIVVGNETYGIVKNTIDRLESAVYIPMFGKGASLNVATATAICLYKTLEC